MALAGIGKILTRLRGHVKVSDKMKEKKGISFRLASQAQSSTDIHAFIPLVVGYNSARLC
jgi:hypothetical protein